MHARSTLRPIHLNRHRLNPQRLIPQRLIPHLGSRRRWIPTRLMPFLLLTLLAAGCDGLAGPAAGLDVTMTVEPAVLTVGDTARIEITVHNATDAPIALHAGSCEAVMRTEVLNLEGEVVVPAVPVTRAGSICVTSSSVIIAPAEPRRFERNWTGEAHFPSWGVVESGEVEPGSYRVVVTLLHEGKAVAQSETAIEVR